MKVRDVHGDYVERDKFVIHRLGVYEDPAEDDPSRECPQCLRLTWRYNDNCHKCGFNLVQFDAAQEAIIKEEKRKRAADFRFYSMFVLIALMMICLLLYQLTNLNCFFFIAGSCVFAMFIMYKIDEVTPNS